jgi:glycosyltransferase involved in cell wall biosynthesis
MTLRVSVILTVKNEEHTIKRTLEALNEQTLKPAEILVADGGSSDSTLEIVREIAGDHDNIRCLALGSASRGAGRNAAIRIASNDLIAVTDAGCVPHLRWLERIVSPMKENAVDVVGGNSVPLPRSLLEFCIAEIAYPRREQLTRSTYLPPSRSLALRRTVWEIVGGYPEECEYGEDTFFDLAILAADFRIETVANAVVFWGPPESLKALFIQSYHYGRGNGGAGMHYRVHLTQVAVYVTGLLLLAFSLVETWLMLMFCAASMLFLYARAIRRLRVVRRTLATVLVSAAVAITIDLGSIFGFVRGLLSRVRRRAS